MRTVTLLVALLVLVLQAAQAQTTTQFTTYFTGGLPFCTQCGTVGQYACSPDANGVTLGQWNNGVISFTDPVPSGNYATNVAVSVFGAFSCNAVGARAMFGMSLNSLVFGVRDTSKGVNQCKCDTCDGSENFSFVFRNGVPGYRYRTTNSLKFEMYKDSICVNRVEVTITYAPILTSPPTPLPELYVPFTIPTGYDRVGCPVCNGNLNQWCSAANNNTLTLSFKDTLPANTYLIAVDAYLSLNLIERASSYASTITVAVQNTNVNTFTLSETGFREKCGCLSDHTLTSATYQRGWPNYAANGGINKVSVSISKYSQSYGNICVGRLALKLMYYTYAKDGEVGELEAMYLDNVDYKVDQVDLE